ncbi:MAG: glycerophosphodiester phosphodiesterase [Acidobacteriia bacterium]|nr:glycerophosphodiester phosphodiesterase [Terriglobia bacterium]MYG02131.1 glycerophosphodiester phosphodiesterase [Terriglobia bacterium]MYK08191.1 glycerophosphodiester phosphodiesterase [Terriglobia bacterium]
MKRSLAALAGRPGRPAVLAGAFAWLPLSAAAVEIVAHRGASYDAPENTLPAVELGWEQGADAVEVDIHQTSDRSVVAIHDRDTLRVAGKRGVVAEMRLDQLLLLDAGAWKGAQWSGTRIPTLEQVLETVPVGKTLVVEIKCPRDVLPELERVLDASGKREQVMLIAFDYDTISEAKKRMPDRPCYWLYGFSESEAATYQVRSRDDLLERVQRAALDGLDVRHSGPWTAGLADALRKLGKALYVYTVNDADQARRLRDVGVAGITTDRPAFLRKALAE